MAGYSVFSQFYDQLTRNVEYPRRAEYFLQLLDHIGHKPGLTLDLACGTGSLTLELYRRGVDVYGVDASVEMLSQAKEKCLEAGADILFLRQTMQDLDLYGTVNTIVCSLDSINHLRGKGEVQKAFAKAFLFLDPGGYFIFDLNTLYKHEKVLGNNTFVYDLEQVYCVWQNHCVPGTGKVDIHLDFFQHDHGVYRRSSEYFSEYAYPVEQVVQWLQNIGFADIRLFDDLSFDLPGPHSQRLVFAAKKQE